MSVTGTPPVRYPSGVSTSPNQYVFGNYPYRTPFRLFEYVNDFNTYAAGDWTVTATGGGTSALTTGNGGFLLLSTASGNGDVQGNELTEPSYLVVAGSQMWFSINVAIGGSITTSAFMAGMSNTFATLAPTAGIYFSKPTGAATLNAIIRNASTSTTIAMGTMAVDTAYTLSWYYDGRSVPTVYFYTTIGMASPTANSQPYFTGGNQCIASASSDPAATNSLANIPTVAMTAGLALRGTTAALRTATVDYLAAAQEIITRF